jgi:hypothetical protein
MRNMDNVAQHIQAKLDERMQKKIKVHPCHVNRSSSVGSNCDRFLYYCRKEWDKQSLIQIGTQYIFEEGNNQEDIVLRDLADAGVKIIEQQRSFFWKDYNLSGHIDGIAIIDGKRYPLEIKSMNPFLWDSMKCLDDMFNAKQHWIRKYPAQMACYLLMAGEEAGIFVLKNKTNGQFKIFEIHLNNLIESGYADRIMKRLDRVNKAVESETIPLRYFEEGAVERSSYDSSQCDMCNYKHLCHIDVEIQEGVPLEWVTDEDKEKTLAEYYELNTKRLEIMPRFNKVDAKIKEYFRGKEKIICGDYVLIGKMKGKSWHKEVMKLNTEDGQ